MCGAAVIVPHQVTGREMGMAFRIQLLPSGKAFMAARNETLLEAALRAGVALKYSCNSGVCGDCAGRVISGQARDVQHHDFHLTDEQKDAGYVLMCCAAPDSARHRHVEAATGLR